MEKKHEPIDIYNIKSMRICPKCGDVTKWLDKCSCKKTEEELNCEERNKIAKLKLEGKAEFYRCLNGIAANQHIYRNNKWPVYFEELIEFAALFDNSATVSENQELGTFQAMTLARAVLKVHNHDGMWEEMVKTVIETYNDISKNDAKIYELLFRQDAIARSKDQNNGGQDVQ